jgi:hypothetical protein
VPRGENVMTRGAESAKAAPATAGHVNAISR